MMPLQTRIYVLIISLLLPFACSKKNVRSDLRKTILPWKEKNLSYQEDSKVLLNKLLDFNKNFLTSLSADFILEASYEKKKIKSMGQIVYQGENKRMNITFIDIIFKSPMTYIFQDNDILKLYFPVDRKLFIDNIKTIKLKYYTDFNLDFQIIYDIITGKIPIIDGYRIKQMKSSKVASGNYLVLENSDYYETISFKGSRPDKMLFLDKNNGKKYEAYFKRYYKKGGVQYFKNIRLTARSGAIKIDVTFTNIKLNLPVEVKTIEDFEIRKDLKIIQMTE